MHVQVYDFFDRVICINLMSRTDKKKKVSEVFSSLNIPAQFYQAQPHPQGGMYGCFHSHIDVIQTAFRDGVQNLLVFEDDVVPSHAYSPTLMEKATSFINDSLNNVDILQLGYMPFVDEVGTCTPYFNASFVDKERHFLKITTAGTHAYCITRKGMLQVLTSNWKQHIGRTHYDMFLVSLSLNGYCFVPTLFDQYSCLGTDNKSRTHMESVVRPFACAADSISLFHKMTIIKHYAHRIMLTMIIVFLCMLLIATIIHMKHR